jgi:hypothetical protein
VSSFLITLGIFSNRGQDHRALPQCSLRGRRDVWNFGSLTGTCDGLILSKTD